MSPAPSPAPVFESVSAIVAAMESHSALVITGPDDHRAAELAVAVARAASTTRSIALGDLTGRASALYTLAGGEDAPGLAECFRDGLGLNDIARPVAGDRTLFVLPAGAGAQDEPALLDRDRWSRLIRGFSEAGGLLVLVVPVTAAVIPVLVGAGASLVLAEATRAELAAVAVAGVYSPGGLRAPRAGTPLGGTRVIPRWAAALAVVAGAATGGGAGVAWIRASTVPDGAVSLPQVSAGSPASARDRGGPDTVTIAERSAPGDESRLSPFSIEVVAANTASNANSLLHDDAQIAAGPAATVSVVEVRSGAGRTARWHKVMLGAWGGAASADSALAAMRKRRTLRAGEGVVVRAPYAMLLADSASSERARAVMEVWRAKGLVPYALTQDDGSVRVFAGAFETVAQGVAMAAIVHDAGGTPIIAFRTGRPE